MRNLSIVVKDGDRDSGDKIFSGKYLRLERGEMGNAGLGLRKLPIRVIGEVAICRKCLAKLLPGFLSFGGQFAL